MHDFKWISCYWKNGKRTDFNYNNNDVYKTYNGMAISNGNIYVSGDYSSVENHYRPRPCFWKNGIRTDLPADDCYEAYATDIFVAGNDVYTVGYKTEDEIYNSDTKKPCYWKNTTCIDITDYTDRIVEATCIYVSGSDVYIGGNYGVYEVGRQQACYWKNDVRTDLPGNQSFVTGIFVENGKVYVSGGCDYEFANHNNTKIGLPCYWVDGQKIDLQIEERCAGISGIFVDNGTVYTLGTRVFSNPYACYWKDNVQTMLDKYNSKVYDSYANAIFVKDGIIFTCGGYTIWRNNDHQRLPCYWVNSKRTELSVGKNDHFYGMAAAIFVE